MEVECRNGEQVTKADDVFSYVSLRGFFSEVDPNASGSVFKQFSPFTLMQSELLQRCQLFRLCPTGIRSSSEGTITWNPVIRESWLHFEVWWQTVPIRLGFSLSICVLCKSQCYISPSMLFSQFNLVYLYCSCLQL